MAPTASIRIRAVGQDGVILFCLLDDDRWGALFLVFTSQKVRTNGMSGEVAPDAAPDAVALRDKLK
jgi:hypothetical protein